MFITPINGAPAWASEHQSTLSAGYLHARTNVPGSDDLNGINVKYRYEFTDTLGLVTSFSYAGDKNRQLTHYSDTTSLAWGAGVQFNPTESVAIDIAYEGSGSGDWRTDGFIVGVGYK
ncbi:hypothetical protein BZK35_25340 [Escherichia coli]|uniref:Ail/Lom family outer membrane beta-barrel protein n=1 Tax=Escherichia coli TaxID=562 RepID=UPI000A3B7521|nr:Ail/Lom family outer membrane beta-barrel protein [Escherichia coli]OUJ59858.1 hypothetical protein BZK35_25340 [Escherichia coli]